MITKQRSKAALQFTVIVLGKLVKQCGGLKSGVEIEVLYSTCGKTTN